MSSDPDALRCFSDDSKLYDPCWASGSKAVCLQDPWTPDAWLFDNPVIEPFERQPIGSTPWALELLDPIPHGKVLRCAFAGGTSDTIAAMRINWRCFNETPSPDTYVGDAVGEVEPVNGGLWTVFYVAKGRSEVQEASIKTIWH